MVIVVAVTLNGDPKASEPSEFRTVTVRLLIEFVVQLASIRLL